MTDDADPRLQGELAALDQEFRAALDPGLPVHERRRRLRKVASDRKDILRRAGVSALFSQYVQWALRRRQEGHELTVREAEDLVEDLLRQSQFALVTMFLFAALLLAAKATSETVYPAVSVPGFPTAVDELVLPSKDPEASVLPLKL